MSEELDYESERRAKLVRARTLLPAWFIPRMMNDFWSFGLLLVTGDVLGIETITSVHRDAAGDIWLDVEMLEEVSVFTVALGRPIRTAPTSRTGASIRAAMIVAAFETADT